VRQELLLNSQNGWQLDGIKKSHPTTDLSFLQVQVQVHVHTSCMERGGGTHNRMTLPFNEGRDTDSKESIPGASN
jgi:hypothetical protein